MPIVVDLSGILAKRVPWKLIVLTVAFGLIGMVVNYALW